MAPQPRRTRSLVHNEVARRDGALRRLRRMTAVVAALAVLATAGVTALAAGTKAKTSTTAQAPRRVDTRSVGHAEGSHARRPVHERRDAHHADADADAGSGQQSTTPALQPPPAPPQPAPAVQPAPAPPAVTSGGS
jgi:hypothetical protein